MSEGRTMPGGLPGPVPGRGNGEDQSGLPLAGATGPRAGATMTPGAWGKVGRNKPCPCGSGKKFKHCHGKVV